MAVREDAILGPLDHWIATLTSPESLKTHQHPSAHDSPVRPSRPRIAELGGMPKILASANPAARGEVFQSSGIRLEYDHEARRITANAAEARVLIVSGGGLVHEVHTS